MSMQQQQPQPEAMEPLDEKAGPSNLAMEVDEPVSVRDRDAFAAKQLPDLGHEVEDFQIYTWRLSKWRQLEKKLTSPEFDCGGHKWRILLFPTGNSNSPPNDTVSIYLDYANPKNAPEGWHACAQFALVMSNPNDPTNFVCSHAHHRFIAEECDWGFTRFHDLRKLFTGIEGRRPIIENDESEITVFVRVLKDPTGVLWHNFVNYDSKKETGYVGLKNQGATCYMNSLLQSLYCTRYFRKAVYQIPTEDDIPSESVALALQRVFYHLQTSDQPVGTTELTKSFGWKSLDSFMQHDVQEFNRVLQDKLESKMKGTPAEGAINKLFLGKMKSYIKCLNVDFESSRTEDFYDIQLNVKGMANLYESFKDYVAVETLEGDNKYQAEGLGLQDAKKGVIFQEFPPVLHLQLKRFEYDIQRDAMVKINDRHEFPFEIDLAEFLDDTADKTQSWVYKLHGVLVHSGDLHGGHYFALIKADRETRWLKYDDDRVTPVTDREVLEENYGGELTNGLVNNQRNPVRQLKRFTNAYMLVYIRESAIDDVLAPFTEKDTPAHLKARLEEERQASEAKKREREEQHLYLTARVITDKTFSNHQGFDLATFDDKNAPQSHDLASFRILKTDTYAMFKSIVAKNLHYPENHIRLWVLVNRQNKTIRPDTHIPEDETTLREPVESIRNTMAARQTDLRLYLDVVADANGQLLPDVNNPNSIMIFLKYFDVSKQTLSGIGKVYVQKNSKVGDLAPIINERMRWQPTTPLKLYEEIKPGMIEVMKPKLTFAQSEIQDGDIVCFQAELSEKEISDFEAQGLGPCRDFFLAHLGDPYPTTVQKHQILKQSSPDFTLRSLNLWFVNIRRRSKWMDIFRTHAGSKRDAMRDLVARVEAQVANRSAPNPLPSGAAPPGCKVDQAVVEEVMAMRAVVDMVSREVYGEGWDQILQIKPWTDEEVRAYEKRTKAAHAAEGDNGKRKRDCEEQRLQRKQEREQRKQFEREVINSIAAARELHAKLMTTNKRKCDDNDGAELDDPPDKNTPMKPDEELPPLETKYLPIFEALHRRGKVLTTPEKTYLVNLTGMTYRQITTWFQNRRRCELMEDMNTRLSGYAASVDSDQTSNLSGAELVFEKRPNHIQPSDTTLNIRSRRRKTYSAP